MDTRLLARTRRAEIIVRIVITALLLIPALSLRPVEGASLQRWAYYVKTDPYSLTTLEIAVKDLDVVLPYYFDVDAAGQIKGSDDPGVTKLIRDAGAKVIPMIQNEARYDDLTPLLQDAEQRSALQDRIVGLVNRYNYDGIQIDFEWMNPTDREAFTQFLVELKGKLAPTGKHLSVAVPDKPFEGYSAWSAAYDYAAIGRAADSVVLMTYGFRTVSSEPGSYAPASWVTTVAKYATTQVPPSKLLLGIGLWGYDWKLDGERSLATARRARDIIRVGREQGAEFGYDEYEHSAWSKYVDEDGVEHIVWYEDKRSVDAKTKIAGDHGLLGIAFWRLGQEDPAVWGVESSTMPSSIAPAPSPTPAPASAAPAPTAAPTVPEPPKALAPGLGRFFTETGSGGNGFLVYDGAPEVDGRPVRFWTEFQRLGGVDVLGYPISHRYVGPDGFTYQAFQRAVLQWRPELDRAVFANTFNILQDAGKDEWLRGAKGIPVSKEDESGGDWEVARAVRFSWLTDEAIRDAYLANPNPDAFDEWTEWESIELYGLPMSEPVHFGVFISQRFQRVTLQRWVEDVPGMPAKGSVVPVLGGEMLKEAGLIPAEATQPGPP